MHETGHNLGLKHGHQPQSGHGINFPTLPDDHDSQEYSVMTYRQFPGNPIPDPPVFSNPDFPKTYMQDDIAALQYLYGANYGVSAHNGPTVYTWYPWFGEVTIDNMFPDFPNRNFVLMTIWDGGGIDTYDFSYYTTNLRVDLNPGAWTILDTSTPLDKSTAPLQRANLGNQENPFFARGNIANALLYKDNPDSLIENTVGGTGDDTLIGNRIDNRLWGNDGNDILSGGEGHDTLNGGTGADLMYGVGGNDLYVVDNAGDRTVEHSNTTRGGVDTVESYVTSTRLSFGLENLILSGAAINGTGNENNNAIDGNAADNRLAGLGGKDELFGYNGHDTLMGGAGADNMYGGPGNDLYVVDNAGDRTVEDSNTTRGGVDTVESYVTSTRLGFGLENLRLSAVAFNGQGNGNNNAIDGNAADNVLAGLGGNDEIYGVGGNDHLFGGDNKDFLSGGDGNDLLNGGADRDTLTGNSGNDTFHYNAARDSLPGAALRDVITDFRGLGAAFGDQIDLRPIDANVLVGGNQSFSWGGPFTAGHLYYASGVLSGNTDADATAEFQIQLVGAPALVVTPTSAGTDILL